MNNIHFRTHVARNFALVSLFFILSGSVNVRAQVWQTVGSPSFSTGEAVSPQMAINNSGTTYVAFSDYALGQKATVMMYNGSSWVVVGKRGFSAGAIGAPSFAIDNNGVPYLAYEDESYIYPRATVMKYADTGWVTVGVAGFSDTMGSISLAIDKSGTPYVVFDDEMPPYGGIGRSTVMKFDGMSWVIVGKQRFSAQGILYPSITIDSSGTPYVAYGDIGYGGKATV